MEPPARNWLTRPVSTWRIRRLESADAVRSVAGRHQLLLLRPFHGREATVSEAAKDAGLSVKKMYYRVQRWHRHGVLEVTRLERRAGKPLKYYSTNCDWLIIPVNMTDVVDTAELVTADVNTFLQGITESFFSHTNFGPGAIHLLSGPDGTSRTLIAPDDMDAVLRAEQPRDVLSWRKAPGTPGMFDFGDGFLEAEEAERFARRLKTALDEAKTLARRNEHSATARRYRVFIGMAPVDDPDER